MRKTRKNFGKKASHPSEKSSWAYYMQAIEPNNVPINRAFPGHHPQWIMQSQKLTPCRENFIMLRKSVICATVDQIAAYLRVDRTTVSRWESGASALPFMAFEALRLACESIHSKLTHKRWDGWFISNVDGSLVSPDRGRLSFGPEELNTFPILRADIARLNLENRRLQSALEDSQAENVRIRELFVTGIVDELISIQDSIAAQSARVSELMARFNTAKIIPFPSKSTKPEKKEVTR